MTQPVDILEPGELEREIEACRALVRDGEAAGDDLSDGDLGPLRRGVDGALAAEQGMLARLRAMPTSRRLTLVVLLSVAVTVASVVFTPRVDLAVYPSWRMLGSLALLGMVTAAAAWRLLRPLYAPPSPLWVSRGLVVAGVLLPVALALIPMQHVGVAADEGSRFALGCGKCLAFGGAMGFPVLLLALLSRRSRIDGAAVTALAGVAAGIAGNLTLQVHCPITEPVHLLIGHALLVVLLAGAAVIWER